MPAPEEVCPYPAAPWRLLELRSDLDRILDGDLSPAPHVEPRPVLLAKLSTPGEASFYTRRSFAVETFTLDEVAASLLPLCAGGLDLRTAAFTVSARFRLPPGRALEACLDVAVALARAGVLGLARARPAASIRP